MWRDRNISTFIACESSYDEADTVLFGAPFDGTTTFRPGTRFAAEVMRMESYGLETYSPYLDRDHKLLLSHLNSPTMLNN